MTTPVTSEEIRKQLADMILSGELPAGTPISEGKLAEKFGVSRTPIREAVRLLADSGLILLRPRQRSIVTKLSLADALDRFEALAMIEAACCELAAKRRSPEALEKIIQLHDAMGQLLKNSDLEAYFEANERFHALIYEASGNVYLSKQAIDSRQRLRSLRQPRATQPERMAESFAEHGEIVAAIAAQSQDRARAAMHKHVIMLGEKLSQFVRDFDRTQPEQGVA